MILFIYIYIIFTYLLTYIWSINQSIEDDDDPHPHGPPRTHHPSPQYTSQTFADPLRILG